ncbi:F-actin-uncapping protein LRRC16A-like [Rhinoraja longicauda]
MPPGPAFNGRLPRQLDELQRTGYPESPHDSIVQHHRTLDKFSRHNVLTSCRVFLLTARIPTKLELTFNYLEIQGISCSKPGQLVVETDRCAIPLKLTSSEEVNEVVGYLGSCLKKMFPGLSPMRVIKKVIMEPADRLSSVQSVWDSQNMAEPGPCGGFSQMYACVCDWLGLPYREEVQWDVDTIYLTQDTKELNLQDFSHLDHRLIYEDCPMNRRKVKLTCSYPSILSVEHTFRRGFALSLTFNTSSRRPQSSSKGLGSRRERWVYGTSCQRTGKCRSL